MGKYKIEIKKSAAKEIRALPNKDIRKVLELISSLAENPRPPYCKKLTEQERYRLRYRHYRILYEIHDRVLLVVVVKIAQRKDVYRK